LIKRWSYFYEWEKGASLIFGLHFLVTGCIGLVSGKAHKLTVG